MIATGYPFDDGRNTEIIDVEDSSFSCTNIEQFPIKLTGATGGLINGQTPFICDGRSYINGSWTSVDDCYQLTEAGSWAKDQRATLTTPRVQEPTGFNYHCQVPWDSEKFLDIGGWDGSRTRETYFINVKTNQMTNGPSLNTARYAHACAELEVNGKSFIIVTGGWNSVYLRSTEILDKNNVGQGWLTGKKLKFFLNICLLDNISIHPRR